MKRGGQPEEVARAILWLLSDEASFTTASFIDVTGGREGIQVRLKPDTTIRPFQRTTLDPRFSRNVPNQTAGGSQANRSVLVIQPRRRSTFLIAVTTPTAPMTK